MKSSRPTAARLPMLAAAIVVLTTCGRVDQPFSPATNLAIGTWGGQNVVVIATDSITHVHVGCTFGDFPGTITLQADGSFTVNGSYMLHAYPVAVGPSMPAQLSGKVNGNTLTFAIAVSDTIAKTVSSLGPGVVQLGKDPQMGACPICQVPGRDRALLIRPMKMSHAGARPR